MRISFDAIIAEDKLTSYLLVHRPVNDKSGYLARGGFTLSDPGALHTAILALATTVDATFEGMSEYGEIWRVEGLLGGTLPVVLIWMRRAADGRFHFVTLKPAPRRSSGGSG